MNVLYNGQCVPIMEEAAWAKEQKSLGDPDVVETVCKGLRDAEPKVWLAHRIPDIRTFEKGSLQRDGKTGEASKYLSR